MRSMTIIAGITIALIIMMFVYFLFDANSGADMAEAPSIEQARPEVAKFLRSEFGKFDSLKLVGPNNISVGEYDPQVQAWPVYSDFQAKYLQQGHAETKRSSKKTPTCFIDNSSGEIRTFPAPPVITTTRHQNATAAAQQSHRSQMHRSPRTRASFN